MILATQSARNRSRNRKTGLAQEPTETYEPLRSTWKKAFGCHTTYASPIGMIVPRQSSAAFFGSRRYAHSIARPQMPMLSLAQPASPMPRPAPNGLLRISMIPATANITDSASLWAVATTAQMSTGLQTVSRAARAWRRLSPCASCTMPAQAMMNGTTVITCSQNTMSCMFSPPR